MTPDSASTIDCSSPCRVADLAVVAAGRSLTFVLSRDTGATIYLPQDMLQLLTSCTEFKLIDEHVQFYAAKDPTPTHLAHLRVELRRLLHQGFLVTKDSLHQAARTSLVSFAPISSICIPTHDRVQSLGRSLTAYASLALQHNRSIDFVIADDCTLPGARKACYRMLNQVGTACKVDIAYAGLDEKLRFSSRLAVVASVPLDVVHYACLGDPSLGVTIGANRNVILLHTVGDRILSSDDDTVCQVATPPQWRPGLALSSSPQLLDRWFYSDRQRAFATITNVEDDLLACHEAYLGHSPASLLMEAGDSASFAEADPALFRRIQAPGSRIRITTNGTVGDCGWDNTDFYLLQDGSTLERLVRSKTEFQSALKSREMVQSVMQPTIAGRPELPFAMSLGVDNTDLLPPFPSIGRGEEIAFGAILASCFADAYVAHLPRLVRHDPSGTRHYSTASSLFAVGFGPWLAACITRFNGVPGGSPVERMGALGEFLTQLGSLTDRSFDNFSRDIIVSTMSVLVSRVESKLFAQDPLPRYWAVEAQQFIGRIRRSALAPLDESYSMAGGRESAKRTLRSFGALLLWWPAIMDGARELRLSGDRLATLLPLSV